MSRSSLTHARTHSLTPPPLPSKANQLSSLSEWKQHARVYATIVTQGSAIAHDATSGIGVHPTNTAHLHIARYVAAGIKPLLGGGR